MVHKFFSTITVLLLTACATPYHPVIQNNTYTDSEHGLSFSLPASWTMMEQLPEWVMPLKRLYVNPKLVLVNEDNQCCIVYATGKLNVSAEDVNQYSDKVKNEVAASLRRSIEKHKKDHILIESSYEVYPIHLDQGRLTALFKLEETAEVKGVRMAWRTDSYLAPSVRRVKTINFIFLSRDRHQTSSKNDYEVLKASAVLIP